MDDQIKVIDDDPSEQMANLLIGALYMQGALDCLRGTKYWEEKKKQPKRKFKEVLTPFVYCLEKMIKEDAEKIFGVLGVDVDKSIYEAMDFVRDFVMQMGKMKAPDAGVMAKILELYKEDKADVMARLDIVYIEPEN